MRCLTASASFLIVLPLLLCAADPSYVRDVRPILDKNCTSCHQPAVKQSDLDLTTYARFRNGGKRGAAFVAGSLGPGLSVSRYARFGGGGAVAKSTPSLSNRCGPSG